MPAYHAINQLAIDAIQEVGDLEQASCLLMQAVKYLQDELKVTYQCKTTVEHEQQAPYSPQQLLGQVRPEQSSSGTRYLAKNLVSGVSLRDIGGSCGDRMRDDDKFFVYYPLFQVVQLNKADAYLRPSSIPPTMYRTDTLDGASRNHDNYEQEHADRNMEEASSTHASTATTSCSAISNVRHLWKHVLELPSMQDIGDRIYTSAFMTFPNIIVSVSEGTKRSLVDEYDVVSKNKVKHAKGSKEDRWIFSTAAVLGALLYNAGLSFHLRWLEVGLASKLTKALKFYHAARTILQTSFPQQFRKAQVTTTQDHHIEQESQVIINARMVMIAVTNNLCSIYHELVRADQVSMLREEMRHISSSLDPLLAFGCVPDACFFLVMNAFDNNDMNAARTA